MGSASENRQRKDVRWWKDDDKQPVWATRVAQTALDAYARLPNTGKPQGKERTALAVFVAHDENDDTVTPVAVGTGTKCMGSLDERGCAGDRVADAHAEIIARRALVRSILDDARRILHDDNDDDNNNNDRRETQASSSSLTLLVRDGTANRKCTLRAGVTLHLYVSCLPCGDASILEHAAATTGAKPLLEASSMPPSAHVVEARDAPAAIGAARRKPGRGFATHCMSCSDKYAKMTLLGVQGSLALAVLSAPIYLDSIVSHAATCFADAAAASLRRAIAERAALRSHVLSPPFVYHAPVCLVAPTPEPPSNVIVGDAASGVSSPALVTSAAPGQRDQTTGQRAPKLCGLSLNWSRVPETRHEVTTGVRGVRAGAGKFDGPVPAKLQSRLCKISMARACVGSVLGGDAEVLPGKKRTADARDGVTYGTLKRTACELCARYHQCWIDIKTKTDGDDDADGGCVQSNPFAAWLVKSPALEDFVVDGGDDVIKKCTTVGSEVK